MSNEQRPKHRGECVDGPRPCPWLGCRYHLALPDIPGPYSPERLLAGREADVERLLAAIDAAADAYTNPDTPIPDGPSCALDLADDGEIPLATIGAMLHRTEERMGQVMAKSVRTLRRQLKIFNDEKP